MLYQFHKFHQITFKIPHMYSNSVVFVTGPLRYRYVTVALPLQNWRNKGTSFTVTVTVSVTVIVPLPVT